MPAGLSPPHAGDAAFIRAATRLAPPPLVPEIRLHLADDAFALWERSERRLGGPSQPPFWAFAWPGGIALARHLLDHASLVAGRSVLDIGSGSGLAAVAALLAGASGAVASELDPVAAAAIRLNSAANGVAVQVTGDVLAADVWYERDLARRVLGLLRRAALRGADVLTADAGRAFLPREMLRPLAGYDVPVIADLEDAAVKHTMILTLR